MRTENAAALQEKDSYLFPRFKYKPRQTQLGIVSSERESERDSE